MYLTIQATILVILAAGVCSSERVNLALNKPAYQISNAEGDTEEGAAGNAVDGNSAADWQEGSCTSTARERRPWWVVDLGAEFSISSVEITNRGDCCNERLSDVFIRLGNTFDPSKREIVKKNFKKIGYVKGELGSAETREVKTKSRLTGRYVLIQLKKRDVLSLCEVKVYGESTNCAWMRPAYQSSNLTRGPQGGRQMGLADKAVDGLTLNKFRLNSCSHTRQEDAPWWLVDLGQKTRIYDVTITNREDCCWDRLHNFTIMIGNDFAPVRTNVGLTYDFKKYKEIAFVEGALKRSETRTIKTKRRPGRYLVVQLKNPGMLALCEVIVNAVPV